MGFFFLPASSVSLSQYWGFCHFLDSLSTSNLNLSCLLYLPDLLLFPCFLPSLLPPPFSLRLLPSRLLPFFPSSPPPGRSGLAASYLSVKALVPQMPKLLKSLFPVRDEKKELRPSPQNQQVSRFPGSLVLSLLHICNRYNITFLFFNFYF